MNHFADKLEIQELSSRYALAMDEGNLSNWIATWADEGSWEGALGTYTGIIQLKKLFADLGERVKNKRHIITNHIIDIDIDKVHAKQTCYMLIFEAKKSGNFVASAIYHDEIKKIGTTWKFSKRKVKLDV